LDEKGRLVVEVYEILELIAQTEVILATGHISPQEIMLLVKESKKRGVQKILITHPSLKLIDLDLTYQIETARMGAYIEHCFAATTEFLRPKGITTLQEIARQIWEVGTDQCIMSSDFGQTVNPHPVAGLREFIHKMLQSGFSDIEIRKMIKDNPEALLDG
jgi:predicted metal-dependent phosphotriesterase family hydrolase